MPWVAAVGAVVGGALSSKSAKDGVKAQKEQNAANEAFIREQATDSRNDAIPLYDAAQQNRGIGSQAALDTFAQTIPEQGRLMGEGNVMAQETLLTGLPQANNALLGMPIDYSGLQAKQLTPDYSFANQQVPEFVNPEIRQRLNAGDYVDDSGTVTEIPPGKVVDPDGNLVDFVPGQTEGTGWSDTGKGALSDPVGYKTAKKVFKKIF